MIGDENVTEQRKITNETLQDVQSKVIELMSATLELNRQLHELANIELYKNKIETLEAEIASLESEMTRTLLDENMYRHYTTTF